MKEPCGCEDEHGAGIDPVEIKGHVTGTMRTNPEAADYASYAIFSFTGTATDAPQAILQRDNDRSRAVIQMSSGSAYLGKVEQIANGAASGWLQTNTMQPLETRNKQPLWAMGVSGSPSVVCVMNERWDSARLD